MVRCKIKLFQLAFALILISGRVIDARKHKLDLKVRMIPLISLNKGESWPDCEAPNVIVFAIIMFFFSFSLFRNYFALFTREMINVLTIINNSHYPFTEIRIMTPKTLNKTI